MRVNFTPGPWIVNPFRAQVDCAALDEWGDPLRIAELLWPTDYRSEAETEANARLIAAAPEMLAALKIARLWSDKDWVGHEHVERAIAKAVKECSQ